MCSGDNIERLFLLEILVENVNISNAKLNLDNDTIASFKQTCVRFQFLKYPPLEICEADFVPSRNVSKEEVSFKSGKSCLFALRGRCPSEFSPPINMDICVCKICGNNRPCTIGKGCIELGECFATIIHCCNICPATPTSKIVKDVYKLCDERNVEIGTISVFIRLSCFGKNIVTQFHLGGLENKSFLFRAESESLKKDEKDATQGKFKTPISAPETICVPSGKSPPSITGGPPMGISPSMMPPMGVSPSMMPPMGGGMPPMMPPMGGGMPPMMPPMGGGMPPPMMGAPNMGQFPMQLKPIMNDGLRNSPEDIQDHDYKELSASVNGHELNIKILRKPKKMKPTRVLAEAEPEVPARIRRAAEKLKKAFCECKTPLPEEILELTKKPKKTNYEMPEPCPMLTGSKGVKKKYPPASRQRRRVAKENYILKLGECPEVCYKMPPKQPSGPCITVRETQFVQEDMDAARVLYEEYLKSKQSGPGSAASGKSDKKDKGGKGGKGKGKGKGKKK